MSRQQQMERQRMREQDQLSRQREQDMLEAKKQADMERDARRLQMEQQIQEERLEGARRRAEAERANIRARAMAEAEGRILEQRKNEDIHARDIQRRSEAKAAELRGAIQEAFSQLSSTLGSYIKDSTALRNTVFVGTALAVGVYGVREGSRVIGRVVERRLLTPALVRETSRTAGTFGLRQRMKRALGMLPAEEVGLDGIVLEDKLSSRIVETASATTNTRRNGAPFRHMLFYGPPGTGKTMVAKRLARTSGLDYAVMSGGDIGPLGKDGVTELHKLLDWGETSKRGLLLFIDEADAFLSSRSRSAMSEDHRNALNALLYRTGEASRSLMLVLATNRPGDLDAAVTDRVDDAVLFGLPDAAGREALVRVYFEKFVVRAGEDAPRRLMGLLPAARASKIEIGEGFTDEYFAELAARTAGFSGRAISKLMLGVQGAVYGRGEPTLTLEIMEDVVQRKLAEFDERRRLAKTDYTDSASEAVTGTAADAAARRSSA